MHLRQSLFFIIVFIEVAYTSYKIVTFWPVPFFVAVIGSISFFAFALATTFIYRRDAGVFDKLWFRALSWTGFTLLGAWATFFLIAVPIDLGHLIVWLISQIRGTELVFSEGLTYFFGTGFALALAVGFSAAGFVEVLRGPRVRQVQIPVDNLNPALQGFKIAQITDLHVGVTVRTGYVNEVVSRTNATEPDLIVITGDLVDAHVKSVREHLKPLGELKAKHGVFYVTGNHEYYWGAKELISEFTSLGMNVLLNENKIVTHGTAKILVAGVTDPQGASFYPEHTSDVKRALRSNEQTDFKIILAHRPDVYKIAEPLGANLQFSGHTHAGQFFPFSLLIGFAHKYYRGLAKTGNLWIYVNPGTGYWGPPNRFAIPPEITLAVLNRA